VILSAASDQDEWFAIAWLVKGLKAHGNPERVEPYDLMAKYPIAVIPFSGLSPSAGEALAAAIDDAVEVLRKWELPTSPNTRLLNARRRLLEVSAQGSYGATPAELYETA